MVTTYSQQQRPLEVLTPLGRDALLLTGFAGREAISRPYEFRLDLAAPNERPVPFEELLGQPAAVRVALGGGAHRYFHGIISRFVEGGRDDTFTRYQATLVPRLWLLTRRHRSRIFQHKTVEEILREVLAGLDVTYQIQGTFHPREYCVQYRESDFAFASRLMEEEGIFYFFEHAEDGHRMVVANTPAAHPELPSQSKILYEEVLGGNRDEFRVTEWEKAQEIRSGKVTLWDHSFELPHQNLEAQRPIGDAVEVGRVPHPQQVGGNDALEFFDYPGGYARRFDGIDRAGGERPADLEKIFEDNVRTARLRMEQEAFPGLAVRGAGNCRHFVSGHRFRLEGHFSADGPYVLTAVEHFAELEQSFRSGEGPGELDYHNRFTCTPLSLPFRPARQTPRPYVRGTQTAVVVGPPGEEIFCDKYGRVKVRFHWDRAEEEGAARRPWDRSCWVRVATIWAGKGWGVVHVPRVGQEVIVAFEEGDPDRPIIVGSVYNADHMPPHELPKAAMVSGIRSNSTPGGGGYNGLTFDDTKGKEKITLHAQYDMDSTVEHDDSQTVHNDRTVRVNGKLAETIVKDTKITVSEGKYEHDVAKGTADYHVAAALTERYDGGQTTTVQKGIVIQCSDSKDKGIQINCADDKVHVTAATEILLSCGKSSLLLQQDGTVKLNGVKVEVTGTAGVTVSGKAIVSKADGTHEILGGLVKIN